MRVRLPRCHLVNSYGKIFFFQTLHPPCMLSASLCDSCHESIHAKTKLALVVYTLGAWCRNLHNMLLNFPYSFNVDNTSDHCISIEMGRIRMETNTSRRGYGRQNELEILLLRTLRAINSCSTALKVGNCNHWIPQETLYIITVWRIWLHANNKNQIILSIKCSVHQTFNHIWAYSFSFFFKSHWEKFSTKADVFMTGTSTGLVLCTWKCFQT